MIRLIHFSAIGLLVAAGILAGATANSSPAWTLPWGEGGVIEARYSHNAASDGVLNDNSGHAL